MSSESDGGAYAYLYTADKGQKPEYWLTAPTVSGDWRTIQDEAISGLLPKIRINLDDLLGSLEVIGAAPSFIEEKHPNMEFGNTLPSQVKKIKKALSGK